MGLVSTNVYIFLMAMVLALLEIQIEGRHGWAENLPTWRPPAHHWLARLYAKLLAGKVVTGYHLAMFAFVFLVFHLPYVFGLPLTLERELKTVSFYFMFVVLWDFLWFVLNPHYPLKRFKREHIWWHKRWLGVAPIDYYGGLALSLLVFLPLLTTTSALEILDWWLSNVAWFAGETFLVVIFTLCVLDIDHWYINSD